VVEGVQVPELVKMTGATAVSVRMMASLAALPRMLREAQVSAVVSTVRPAEGTTTHQKLPALTVPFITMTIRPVVATNPDDQSVGRVRAEAAPFHTHGPFWEGVDWAVRSTVSRPEDTKENPSTDAGAEAMFTLAVAAHWTAARAGMRRFSRAVPLVGTSERLLVFWRAPAVRAAWAADKETTGATVDVPVTVMVPSALETEVTVPEPPPPPLPSSMSQEPT
jgi:hypothetical protein